MSGSLTEKRLSRNWVVQEDLDTRDLILKNDDTGRTLTLGQDGSLEGELHVHGEDDLPDVNENGRHPIGDQVLNVHGVLMHDAPLERVGDLPIVGAVGDATLWYTGTGTQLTTDGNSSIVDGISFVAPDGTVLDETGTQNNEHLWLDSAIGLKPETIGIQDGVAVGDFGSVTGFRVPSFKGVNFEGPDTGASLVFDGSPDKIYLQGCPLRNVATSGVRLVELASTLTVDLVDITGGFSKNVQADSEIVYVDPSATIGTVFKYTGQLHDDTVTRSNILTGAADVGAVGYYVKGSYPLRDSKGVANLDGDATLASPHTVTITDTSSFFEIDAPSTLTRADRFTQPSDGVLEWQGKPDETAEIECTVVVDAGSDDVTVSILKDGTPVGIDVPATGRGGGVPVSVPIGSIADVSSGSPGTQISVGIRNDTGSNNVDVVGFGVRVIT